MQKWIAPNLLAEGFKRQDQDENGPHAGLPHKGKLKNSRFFLRAASQKSGVPMHIPPGAVSSEDARPHILKPTKIFLGIQLAQCR